MARKIIVAVDASEHSKFALQWAVTNLFRSDDAIVLLTVQEKPDLAHGAFSTGDAPLPAEAIESMKTHVSLLSRTILKEYADLCAAGGFANVDSKVEIGEVKDSIVSAADNVQADFLVCGSRHLGTIERAILGSVSGYLERHSKVPVIVVNMPAA